MNSDSRKVLIIVENLPVPFDTRVWQEATTLAMNGYTVSVICPKGKGYTQEEEYLQGVHIFRHDLPAEGNGAVGYAKEYLTALKEELRLAKKVYKEIGFDVIHGCNPPDDIYMVAKHFKKYLLHDEERLSKMSKACLEVYDKEVSIDRMFQGFKDAIEYCKKGG